MYCPNCGNQTWPEQHFCLSCGLELEKITRISRQGVIASSVFGAGILGLLLYGVVYQLIITQGKVFEGFAILGFVALIASGLLGVYLFAKAEIVGKKSKSRQINGSEEVLPPTPTARILAEGHFDPVPTVTEHTTELLVERDNRIKET
jgi:hypothetical protein